MGNRATKSLLAVSGQTAESGINTPQTTDMSLLVGADDYLNLDPRRDTNADEMNGREEADAIYNLGNLGGATLNFGKLQPHQAGFILGYGLGSVATVAAGSGHQHTITPIAGDLDTQRSNPSFTAVQRLGDAVAKRRFSSCFVDTCSLDFAVDDWCKGSATIKSTGYYEDSITEETVSALNNAASITLAANGVQGATAAERLDNVHVVRTSSSGSQYTFVTVTAVSSAVPAVITIDPLSGDGLSSIDYQILYVPVEDAWGTFPARIVETPMRVSQAYLYIGGGWDGTAFVGGKALTSVLSKFNYTLNNNIDIKFTFGSGGQYAGKALRSARTQTVTIARELRDWLVQHYLLETEYFGLHVIAEGAEFDTGQKYTEELIFPRLAAMSAPVSTDSGRISEEATIQVLEDATYGSVIARVKNLVATIAA